MARMSNKEKKKILEEKAKRKEARLIKKEEKKLKAHEAKLVREENARKLLDSIMTPKKIKPDTLKKILKLIILIVGILFAVEVIMSIPGITGFFNEWLHTSQSSTNNPVVNMIWVYIVVAAIAFLQTLPIFNMPMFPFISILFGLGWLTGQPKAENVWVNFGMVFSAQGLLIAVSVIIGYMIGVIVNYYLGYLLGEKAYQWVAGDESNPEDFKRWSDKINGKTGKGIYLASVILPVFPDDLLLIVVGASKMNSKFVFLSNLVGRFIGLVTMMVLMPFIPTTSDGEFPLMAILYGFILLVAVLFNVKNNRWLNMNMPKSKKIDSSFEEVIARINNRTSVVEEVISDIAYKIDGKTKSAINTSVDLLVFAVIDYESYINRKIRILVRCKSANYYEVIFDHTYMMSEKIDTLISDLREERKKWSDKIVN